MKLQYSSKIGWPLLILLSFLPLFIWMFTPYSLDQRFMRGGKFNYSLAMQALGQGLGLVGFRPVLRGKRNDQGNGRGGRGEMS